MDNNYLSANNNPRSPVPVKFILFIILLGIGVYLYPLLINFIATNGMAIVPMESSRPAATAQPTSSSSSSAVTNTSTALENTLKSIEQCLRKGGRQISATIKAYSTQVKFASPEQTHFQGYANEADWRDCQKELNKVISSNGDATSEIIRAYITAGDQVTRLLSEITPYYKQKDFLDDKFVKGKETDPTLTLAFHEYLAKESKLHNLWFTTDQRLDEDKLKIITDKSSYAYITRDLRYQMKALEHVISSEPLDIEQVTIIIPQLAQAQKKLVTIVIPQLDTQTAFSSSLWQSTANAAENTLVAAKATQRLLRDGKPIPQHNDGSIFNIKQQISLFFSHYEAAIKIHDTWLKTQAILNR
ncbi:MAG: DUF3829 domain-containing protein [Candidatus Abawacabacteria bacterium]|nr:DUF3829 domain-containing protein [Candidatus Abawacabacteria bacterium]